MASSSSARTTRQEIRRLLGKELITLEFGIARGSKGPGNFEIFACLLDEILNQSGLYILYWRR